MGRTTRTVDPDSGGNRVQRKDPSGTTVYLPGTELKLSADGAKKEATRYYSHAGQTVAVRTGDGKVSFIAADHHGTGELAVDAATGAVSRRRFDPYGVERGAATGTWPGEKGYVGGTMDKSTGLTHLGAREYDAGIGKFISVDPLIDPTQPQQMNGYAYANNSPVTHADPSGMIVPECMQGLIECRGGFPVPSSEQDPVDNAQNKANDAASAVQGAQGQQSAAKQRIKSTGKALVKIVRDILGVDAALDCISTGDLGSCGETVLNIAGSFAGGLAGKILAKYGAPSDWAKGARLAKRVIGASATSSAESRICTRPTRLSPRRRTVWRGLRTPWPWPRKGRRKPSRRPRRRTRANPNCCARAPRARVGARNSR
ncbi:RHS repeat domain-containing protein [Streptomyces sp. NPDC087420]|uniref:RHS repeat domain-containing protein n=1 Tax=Streptomyces sp. NPDC087420 TaxID=3365785 RepID=UPI00383664EC